MTPVICQCCPSILFFLCSLPQQRFGASQQVSIIIGAYNLSSNGTWLTYSLFALVSLFSESLFCCSSTVPLEQPAICIKRCILYLDRCATLVTPIYHHDARSERTSILPIHISGFNIFHSLYSLAEARNVLHFSRMPEF